MNDNKEVQTEETTQPTEEGKSLSLDEIIEVTLEMRF